MPHSTVSSRSIATLLATLFVLAPLPVANAGQTGGAAPLRLAIAGLTHGHVDGFFRAISKRTDVELVGVYDPDTALQKQYGDKYHFASTLFFTDLGQMLDKTKPEAVAAFSSTFDHPTVVEAAARRHIHVMMEKPLAVSNEAARRIEQAAQNGRVQVIVNYETTWYRSHGAIGLLQEEHSFGTVNKMVAMDGHQGPQEIHVGPEFFAWLTDPAKNGAGALFDFGCYGANLMTWILHNEHPTAVTALTQTRKRGIYPHVDDQATVLVQYANAQGIIQASWDWPFNRKDFEVYGDKGYAIATGGNSLRTRFSGDQQEDTPTLNDMPSDQADSVSYLKAVVRGKLKPEGLSSLENNLIVTEILVAARESAQTGRRVALHSEK